MASGSPYVVLATTLLALSVNASGPLSIEQILSPPFPTELVAAPAGGKVAWVLYEEGRRNIYAAAPPDFTPRRLTNYDQDDGQEITNLAWLPDARGLIYIRGGAPNRAGDFPNPAGFPQGADRAIWGVGADGGGPFRIADGAGPAISPDGKRLAYVQRGEVWITSLEQRERPEKVLSVRGGANSLRWSPDGTRLAFVSGCSCKIFAMSSVKTPESRVTRNEYLTIFGGKVNRSTLDTSSE